MIILNSKAPMKYVKNRDLREEIIRCKDASLAYSDELIEMFTLIAERLSHKFYYVDPMDGDDCRQQAVMDMFMYWKGYNPEKSPNAFAYITQIAKNGMAKGWNKLHPLSNLERISYSGKKIHTL